MSYTRLTRDFYQAVEALMEGKVEEKLDPQASEGGGSHPKTDKHKKLAAMGHPKDKITHKDVLIARGVVAKEELLTQEEFDELSEEDQVLYLEALDQLDEKDHMKNGYNYRPKNTAPSPQAKARYKEKVSTYKEEAELEEGKETEQMMVKSFKPEVVDALNKRGVTKHPPYRNPGLEKLAAQKKAMKEEVEEEVDQIITENNSFEIEVPARLTYKDYLDAAMQFVDAEDALTVAEAFYNEQDESLVIESFVRSDIEQKVKVHQNAGNQVSMPKFGTKDGKPYAEYVVTNKDDGIRRKYIHHGTMRRVENMGARGKKDAD